MDLAIDFSTAFAPYHLDHELIDLMIEAGGARTYIAYAVENSHAAASGPYQEINNWTSSDAIEYTVARERAAASSDLQYDRVPNRTEDEVWTLSNSIAVSVTRSRTCNRIPQGTLRCTRGP